MWSHGNATTGALKFIQRFSSGTLCGSNPKGGDDTRNADAIAGLARSTIRLPIRFSGHGTYLVLHEGNTLGKLITQIVEGQFDPVDFRRVVRESRRNSATYVLGLARAQPPWRSELRRRLLEKATGLSRLPLASA